MACIEQRRIMCVWKGERERMGKGVATMRRGFLFSVAIVLLLCSVGLTDVGRYDGFAVGSAKEGDQTSRQIRFTVGMNSVVPKQYQAARAADKAGTHPVPPAVVGQIAQHQILEQALSLCPPIQWQMPHQCRAFGLHLGPKAYKPSGLDSAFGVQAFVYVYDHVIGGADHASAPSQCVRAAQYATASGGACCDSDKGGSSGGGCTQVGIPH